MTPQKPALDMGLVVRDLELQLGFYRDGLGLAEIATRTTGWGSMVELSFGESVLRLLRPVDEPDVVHRGMTAVTGVRYLTFPIGDFDETLGRLVAAGVPVTVPTTAVRDVRFVMLEDPEGNVVELLTRAGGA